MRGRISILLVPLAASALLPFAVFRANRIAAGEPRSLIETLGTAGASAALLALGLAIAALMVIRQPLWRLGVAVPLLVSLVLAMGWGAARLGADAPTAARIGPGAGFWIALTLAGLLLIDALARLRPGPAARLGFAAGAVALVWLLLGSGVLAELSVMEEYRSRSAAFWREGGRHLWLAFGSFGVAMAAGVPLGIALARAPRLRQPVLGALTAVQTIPSIALFGMLILPLGWVAANLPGAAALGIRGIGMAPAFVALLLYSLLPIVANTVAGLTGVPRSVTEAADGMGLTRRERLWRVDIPLAAPVIVAAARIVLVQNIGMATVGALIGAGGFGTFVFQGIGQTATDLILLGALPTVALAFVTSAVLDAAAGLLPGAAP
ncbi:ABC transporter permease [Paracoccus sp. Z118]|uniref:ABC transporter permease n=1 Tax=Paracoccus sp. Z118 TaxID=2851017 RepID=UPI001C2BFA12|nr:ABC transporter permease [Paracoccus sp. Z118]